jgi:hypothetical protein
LKILDLGLARLQQAADSAASTITGSNTTMLGTLDYMAPEQAMDSHSVDIRADIYSLGCTLFYLLTGQPPFPGGSNAEKLVRHQMKLPPDILQVRPDVSPDLAATLNRMLAKEPGQRFQTPREVVQALHGEVPVSSQAAISESLTPLKPAAVERELARKRWLVGTITGGVVLFALFVAFLVLLGRSLPSPTSQQAKPVAQPRPAATTVKETFEQWLAKTATLPEQRQQAAVVQKLKERNPKFDGQVQFGADQYGPFVTLSADDVQDLAPLRALSQLRRLRCSGSARGRSKLVNLGPLQGVPLVELQCATTPIADLEPLRGMPLTNLAFTSTQVSDLRPLQGMNIHTLNCSHTMVSDLTPLRGMPLTWLQCHNTLVDDLQPLQGMKLVHFTCEGCKVRDLKPLQGMPLESLWCDFEPKRDAEILRSIKTLKEINRQPVQEFWKKQGLTPP